MGAAMSTPEKNYKKISFSDMQKSPVSQNAQDGWISMMQHYFISAWVPEPDQIFHYYTSSKGNKDYAIGVVGPQLTVLAGNSETTQLKFYAGPTETHRLAGVAPHLDLTVDYGWLWLLSEPIFKVMHFFHGIFGNWGWSIILVTVLIKLLFYPLSSMSYRSMAGMRTLQPKLKALKERCGDDKKKMSEETMALYRREKINPLSGCLPILIQIPFFIALYYVLMESVELRQAPFVFWIHDLSTRDPYFILPILMGASMYLQQMLSPQPADATQAQVMRFLPIVFTGMFMFFPAGLVLYWLTNNLLSVTQQWYITRQCEKASSRKKK
jgi:YidC/Oxa1 family membrane protein insertase